MSLNKTLDRVFDEIRREAKRNPEFADRLDAVMRAHASRRAVADELVEEAAAAEPAVDEAPAAPPEPASAPASRLNPAGVYKRDGEEALVMALAPLDAAALVALIAENNLDPSGAAEGLDRAGLTAYVVAQAKRRAERDDKMFDY